MASSPRVIVFDGEIGAGKTTLLELVRRELAARGHAVEVVPEPVDDWKRVGILQEFYEDSPPPLRGFVAYDFQTYAFVTRVAECLRCFEAAPDAEFFLLERSVLTDRFVFMELLRDLVGPRRMEMYDRWWTLWDRVMPFTPSKLVYLKPSLDRCMARVAARGREGEACRGDGPESSPGAGGVSAAYQAQLRHAHEAFLQGLHAGDFPGMPPRPFEPERDVTVIDGPLADDDFAADPRAAERIVARVLEKACFGAQAKATGSPAGRADSPGSFWSRPAGAQAAARASSDPKRRTRQAPAAPARAGHRGAPRGWLPSTGAAKAAE